MYYGPSNASARVSATHLHDSSLSVSQLTVTSSLLLYWPRRDHTISVVALRFGSNLAANLPNFLDDSLSYDSSTLSSASRSRQAIRAQILQHFAASYRKRINFSLRLGRQGER